MAVVEAGEVEAEPAGDGVDLGCAGQGGVGEVDGEDHDSAGSRAGAGAGGRVGCGLSTTLAGARCSTVLRLATVLRDSLVLRRLIVAVRLTVRFGEEVLAAGDVAECFGAAHGQVVGGAVEEQLVGDLADGCF
ncbi:unannotated protein [freshwater metagenome]|uniref:Unannotated protein n=1 Tax=freshwater metagenome TaxID=449393 RepID=A0A6J6VC76_9ZZZZ